jgi:transcription elongation GreA/GreB family factor
MSRAFVKEAENETVELPDRPVFIHRYFVTEAAATDKGDKQAAALMEIRHWRTRRASAEVVKRSADKSQASFGVAVTCAGTTPQHTVPHRR